MKNDIVLQKNQILNELRRRQAKKADEVPKFNFAAYCFDSQVKFFKGKKSRFKVAVCSRRAGKSQGIAADMVDTCTTEANVICLYLTLSKRNARSIIWGIIQQIITDHKIECKINQV